MVRQNKSDNRNGHALQIQNCLIRMVLQNKSDNSTVHLNSSSVYRKYKTSAEISAGGKEYTKDVGSEAKFLV
jgi:hypothetical protein